MTKKIIITEKKDKDGKKGAELELMEIDLSNPGDIHDFNMLMSMARREFMRKRKEV